MILKRMNAPKTWGIERKDKKFIVGVQPGPHSLKESLPLGLVLRDALHVAENMSEAKDLLNMGMIKVNHYVRKSKHFPVGLMDILEIGDMHYL
ncbi:MAG: 30S ribosomal protein S4e, partial [Candidatus Aenigmarchaeota archaeon]|nr:30S ribosomal protein S4e [Candidatus Aenigmarchaeota archaeon]